MNAEDLIKVNKLRVNHWIDAKGKPMKPVNWEDYAGKFKVIYAFQDWCPGCHSKGLPDLKKMVYALKENKNVVFFAIQTVFEGFEANTQDKLRKNQLKYDLEIPFGHDAGDDGKSTSNVMKDMQTGGTPWFVFVDKHDNVVFSNFHLNVDNAIEFLKTL